MKTTTKESFKRYNRNALLADADMMSVVQYLGIEIGARSSAKRIQILCPSPSHSDSRKGNCIADSKGVKCFACGFKGTVLDLIMLTLNCTLSKAMEILAGINGAGDGYVDHNKVNVLSQAECDVIGLNNEPVRVEKGITSNGKLPDTEVIPSTLEEEITYYIKYGTIDANPLRTLKEDKEWQYKHLIQRFAEKAIKNEMHWFNNDYGIERFWLVTAKVKINKIKAIMDKHGIRCSKATSELINTINNKIMEGKHGAEKDAV